jgi:hypothetical protein
MGLGMIQSKGINQHISWLQLDLRLYQRILSLLDLLLLLLLGLWVCLFRSLGDRVGRSLQSILFATKELIFD